LNSKLLDEIKKKNYALIQEQIGSFIIEEITKRKAQGVIFGLSGGIDSVVVSSLCSKYVRDKCTALIMPQSGITPKIDTNDAKKMADVLCIEYKVIDIGIIHKEYSKYLDPYPLALGNLTARIRSNILYYHANFKNYLVLGTSDKSEYLIGYFTKFGDGAADLLPIISLYKTQVRELARILGVPTSIISKPSGAHLWVEHTAESELKLDYEKIDSILYCIFEKNLSLQETSLLTQIPIPDVQRIYQKHEQNEHKRQVPKSCIL